MSLVTIENIAMLLAAVVGLFISVFHYIDRPKRGWLYITGYFLAHFLSDYYWSAYVFVIHDDPDVSAIMAYFGWNLSYLLLLFAVMHMREPRSKKYFNPLMLIPIPVNIAHFILYVQYGGIFNNLWDGLVLTAVAIFCLQSILYYLKRRDGGVPFPWLAFVTLIYTIFQYGMWTSTCFWFSSWPVHPYYLCAFANYITMLFLPYAIAKDYVSQGLSSKDVSTTGMRFRMLLQIVSSVVISGGCIAGIQAASRMKASLTPEEGYARVAILLFIISIILVLLIVFIIFVITLHYKKMNFIGEKMEVRDNRITFIATVILSLVLMIISVIYTSRLFYRVSVEGRHDLGVDTSRLVATEIENYLSATSTALMVTADTIDNMLKRGEEQERILTFFIDQTDNYKRLLDENLTGLYGVIRGEYMDGLEWVPPDDYDPKKRGWYNLARQAGGEAVIVPPYIDAQTGEVVITITRQISDCENQEQYDSSNIVAVDIIVNHIQDIVEQTTINGKGMAMVVNRDGMIIAHQDREKVGSGFRNEFSGPFFSKILQTENGTVQDTVDGEKYTAFVRKLMDQWYTVVVISDSELLEEANLQLAMSVTVSFVIFALISFFYFLSYRNEQTYSRRMEEMRLLKNKQEFEAKALKLEKQAADQANRAKSSFLADMSHEIRTPINAILGMNEMILRESEDKDILDYAGNIDASGKNLLQLINSILDFSKIEDGKMEIVPVVYSLSTSIGYLYNSIIERARSKKLEFKTDIDPAMPSKLYGDDTRINQVIMNLLTNAVKYTREGSVTLLMKQKEKKDGKVLLRVEVKDTGIGIKEEDLPRLFESFQRLDQVKNKNIEGTGLGMSIVTKLLTLMNSELKVESVYGEGSTFSFEIWQEVRDDTPMGEFDPSGKGSAGHNKNAGSLSAPDAYILITDDTKMNIMVVQNLLKRTGIKIDTAASGPESIALCEKNAYDVILMDQRMPGMDGTEALQKIRALESAKNADNPIICLTADAIMGAKERYMAQGFTDYLTKPVNGADLENMLKAYLPKEKIVAGESTL